MRLLLSCHWSQPARSKEKRSKENDWTCSKMAKEDKARMMLYE